jgi:hypothetical protein
MALLRRKLAAAALCAVALAVLAGCGNETQVSEGVAGAVAQPDREGKSITIGGLQYTVYITRELNLRVPPDQAYYSGPEAPPGQVLYGVFLQACNSSGGPKRSAATFKITDNQGNEFAPTPADPKNPFQYRPRTLPKNECIPQAGSVAQLGPAQAAVVLFKLPLTNTENRPLDLDIQAPDGDSRSIELDI